MVRLAVRPCFGANRSTLSGVQLFCQIAPEENPSLETHAETLGTVKLIGRMYILVSGAEGEKDRVGPSTSRKVVVIGTVPPMPTKSGGIPKIRASVSAALTRVTFALPGDLDPDRRTALLETLRDSPSFTGE